MHIFPHSVFTSLCLPGVALCNCIQPVLEAKKCSALLFSSIGGMLHCLPPFSNKHSAGQSLHHTCGRKRSSSVFRGRLEEAWTRAVLSVHAPCGRPRCTCNSLERNEKQVWLKKDTSHIVLFYSVPGSMVDLAAVLRKNFIILRNMYDPRKIDMLQELKP